MFIQWNHSISLTYSIRKQQICEATLFLTDFYVIPRLVFLIGNDKYNNYNQMLPSNEITIQTNCAGCLQLECQDKRFFFSYHTQQDYCALY